MEQATPPTTTTQNCQWCTKSMDAAAVRCSSCGKLRKNIYNDKIKCYSFCVLGGVLIGIGISMSKSNRNEFYEASSNGSTGTILLVIGILSAIVGLFFYYKVSQQLKTYWWS